jgi:hypothetical protein
MEDISRKLLETHERESEDCHQQFRIERSTGKNTGLFRNRMGRSLDTSEPHVFNLELLSLRV